MRIEYVTGDGVTIVGEYVEVAHAKGWVLLSHMMPETKESWAGFQSALAERGIASLAIDLRGHGESQTDELDYREFSDAEHKSSIQDLRGAIAWLYKHGAVRGNIALCGASIGANLSIQALAGDHDIPCALLMSAGYSYRGIEIEPLALQLATTQSVQMIAAADDPNGSLDAHRVFARATHAKAELREFETGGHGTNLFTTQPELLTETADWILKHLS